MKVQILNGVPRVLFEESDKIKTPEKRHTRVNLKDGVETRFYLSEIDKLKTRVVKNQKELLSSPSNKALQIATDNLIVKIIALGGDYTPEVVNKPDVKEGSSTKSLVKTDYENFYSGLSEIELRKEHTKLKEEAHVKPENYVKSAERRHMMLKFDPSKGKVPVYFNDAELDTRRRLNAVGKLLSKFKSRVPVEHKAISNETKLFKGYGKSDITFYFLIDLASVLGFDSGRENVKSDAYSKYYNVVTTRVGASGGYMNTICNSTAFLSDLHILKYYCNKLQSGSIESQTFKWFCCFWLQKRCRNKLDNSEQDRLYDIIKERIGKSAIEITRKQA